MAVNRSLGPEKTLMAFLRSDTLFLDRMLPTTLLRLLHNTLGSLLSHDGRRQVPGTNETSAHRCRKDRNTCEGTPTVFIAARRGTTGRFGETTINPRIVNIIHRVPIARQKLLSSHDEDIVTTHTRVIKERIGFTRPTGEQIRSTILVLINIKRTVCILRKQRVQRLEKHLPIIGHVALQISV